MDKGVFKGSSISFSLILVAIFVTIAMFAFATIESITSNSPINDFNTSDNTPNFQFTIVGNSTSYNCTLYLNDTAVASNISVFNNTATVLTSSVLNDGTYYWYVNCTDSDSIVNQSEYRNITIDATAPTIVVTSPINNSHYNYTENISVIASATDNLFIVDEFWFSNGTGNTTYVNELNLTLPDGTYNFVFYANDTLGNLRSRIVTFVVDTTNPTVNYTTVSPSPSKNGF